MAEPGVRGPAIRLDGLRQVYRHRRGLWKKEPDVVGVDGMDLVVERGEVHGLLGPNGAGKSTICKVLATVLIPTQGSASVLGHDVVRDKDVVRGWIALVLGGERGLYYRLTARQNLRFWGALYGLADGEVARRATELLERVGLTDRADDRVETYSRGMKQRLHLARGLLTEPELILLDEPTTGMDPVATKEFHALIRQIRDGRTILLTTHDMVEAEQLCDRVTLINHGKVIATESPRTLATWVARYERVDAENVADDVMDKISELDGVGTVERRPTGGVRIETVAQGASRGVLQLLLDSGNTSVRTSLPSLEEVYLHLVGDRG